MARRLMDDLRRSGVVTSGPAPMTPKDGPRFLSKLDEAVNAIRRPSDAGNDGAHVDPLKVFCGKPWMAPIPSRTWDSCSACSSSHTLLQHADFLGLGRGGSARPTGRTRLDRRHGGLHGGLAQVMETRLADVELSAGFPHARLSAEGVEDRLEALLALHGALKFVEIFGSIGPTSTHDAVPP
jgi:hypothetical protein